MADKKKKGNDMVQQYTEMLEQGIRDVFENGKFDEYLQTMSRFHNYSARNITLIHQQLPGATHVAGFNKWRDEFDRHVVRGQSAIKIWAPTPYKVKEEQVKTDPNTGRPVMGTDGKPITEEVETTRPSFRLVNVFDVSQTDGKPLPQLAENIDGDVQYYDLFRQALEQSTDRPITYEPMRDGLDGFVRISDGSIHIATGMSQAQTVAALLHEMTHATLGHDKEPEEPETAGEKEARNNREEVEAESVAYVVAQYFGIDTGANSFGYVAAWSKDKGLDELKASLDTIKKTASQMISVIDENFAELKKEHGIEQTTIEAEAVRVIPSHESAIAFATDFHTYMQTHNEAAGLPRFGMDEPHLVIAQITHEIIDGSGIEDIRDTIRQRLDEGIEAATAEKLLRRLHGFEKVEYIMPEPEEGSRISTPGIEPEVPDETEPALHQYDTDAPELNPVEQFGVDYFTFMNERRAEENTRPYTEDRTPAENLEGFEAVFREGGNGQIRYVLESWMEEGKQPAAEQAKALLDKLDTLETELWPNRLETPDTAERLAYDLNEFMQEFDPYEYRDTVPDEEEQILHDTTVISNGGNEFEGIKKFLMEITADEAASDDVAKAKSLLERLNAYQSSHHQQAVSETIPEREQPDRTRSVPKLELSEQVADTTITPEQFDAITDDSLLPLNQNRALELFAQEQSIYRMDHMGNAFMIVNESEIMQHGGLFAIDADDWKELFAIALPPDKELAGEQDQDIPLLPGEGDRYAIYQIENTRDVEYAWRSLPNMEALQYEHYKQAYTAPLEPGITLDHLWERHNADDRPAGQTMRSMSMSDVVVMVRNGKEQAFYVGDSFTEVPQFLEQGKAAEVQRQTEPEQPEVFRYYSTQRPVDIGTYPTGKGILLVNFENYDTRQWVENDSFQAWGYLEYRQPLTSKQISDYELRAAPPAESHIRAAEMSTEDNYNQIDGIPNNTTPKFDPDLPEPGNAKYGMEAEFLRSELEQAEFGMSKEDYVKSNFGEDEAPSLAELEADAAAGRQVSLLDLANAMKADKSNNPDKDKKKSLLGQLGAYKKQTNRSHEDKKPQQDRKNDEREV